MAQAPQSHEDARSTLDRFELLATSPKKEHAYPRAHILIIDDDPMIETLAAHALKQDAVELFQNPRAALARVQETLFDMVFCGFLLPEMSGIEVYETLARTNPVLAEHFVLMTGSVADSSLSAFLVSRRAALLCKPFSANRLDDYVRKSLAARLYWNG